MRTSLRRLARRGFERTGLIGPYYRWLEHRAARRAPDEAVEDGRPMPSLDLIVQVSGPSRAWFSGRGRTDAARFRALAKRYGCDLADGPDVLDFGCGAGRIARWLAAEVTAARGRFYGRDINARLVAWCAANLPGDYARNALQPPLDLPASSVDLIYAHSVLTHLTEATTRAWLAEFARILEPGGLALLTFHDEGYAERWGPPGVVERLAAEPFVVWNNALEGSNYLSAWTRGSHLSALAGPWFDCLETVPSDAVEPGQAIAVFRRKA